MYLFVFLVKIQKGIFKKNILKSKLYKLLLSVDGHDSVHLKIRGRTE